MSTRHESPQLAAYGGPGWQSRSTALREELGSLWGACGLDSEWMPLQAVLLHRPGPELEAVDDAHASLMVERPDAAAAAAQHDRVAAVYRAAGVAVEYVEPPVTPPPNQVYAADLFVMTPEGAIVGRPASPVRAGEERWVQRRLADLGVPIIRAVGGRGTFEGADLMWLDGETALLGLGLRTNDEGAAQVAAALASMGIATLRTVQPPGTMHLMGQLRIVDRDLAFYWPGRLAVDALRVLETHGYRALPIPDETEAEHGFGLNFVTLGPRSILMPEGCPRSQAAYEAEGVRCRTIAVDEIAKAAGGIGCLSGILRRASAG
jgi:arginine deiminase